MREHGTVSMYQTGCRCDRCTRAQRDYMRSYRERRRAAAGGVVNPIVDASRAKRALAELVKLGFRKGELAELLGYTVGRSARTVVIGARCLKSRELDLEQLLEEAREGKVTPAGLPPKRVLRMPRRVRVQELLALRDRGVEMRAGAVLQAELAELRRMRRAS